MINYEFYFSTEGRISRRQYWLQYALPSFAISLMLQFIKFILVKNHLGLIASLIVLLWSILNAIVCVIVSTKRLHDTGRSGHMQWLYFIPIVGMWPAILITLVSGDISYNKYGEDPLMSRPRF